MILKEIEEINNEIHLDTRFRYLLETSKLSKKDTGMDSEDSFILTSIIKVHEKQCANIYCVCKNRADLYDSKKEKHSNLQLASFKDAVFIKMFLLMLIQNSKQKLNKSFLINLDYCLFILHELKN